MTATGARLVTISMSHFCEKGRWALDLAGVRYTESGHAPVLHLPHIAARRAGTTPVLDLPSGPTVRGSDAILAYAGAHGAPELLPADPALRREVDRWLAIADGRLVPATRRWFYSWAVADADLLTGMARVNAPGWERAIVPVARPAIARLVSRRFGVGADARETAAAEALEVFAEADAAREPDTPYLVGGRFTAADLAFAALGAPLVFPDGYGPCGALTFDDLPPAMASAVAGWREQPSGAAIGLVYERHRRAEFARRAGLNGQAGSAGQ